MLELLISLFTVILISAMCSLFEAVLLSTPRSHIEKLVSEGKASGRIFSELRRDVDKPLSAILSLNTIANTGGAAVAGAAFVKVFGASLEALFTVFITLAVLFFSEVIPKTAGVVYNRLFSSWIAGPLRGLVLLFMPLIAVCRLVTRAIARGRVHQAVSGEELILMARLGQQTGALHADEVLAIQNILSLRKKTAKEVMTPRTVLFSLEESLTVEEALGKSPVWRHSRVPVYAAEFEDIVGIVLRDEVLEAQTQGRKEVRLSELMRPAHFVLESNTLDRALEMFLERRQHMIIVLDEYGGLSGVLTLEDVLEEILGREIVDELDQVTDMRALARKRRQDTMKYGDR